MNSELGDSSLVATQLTLCRLTVCASFKTRVLHSKIQPLPNRTTIVNIPLLAIGQQQKLSAGSIEGEMRCRWMLLAYFIFDTFYRSRSSELWIFKKVNLICKRTSKRQVTIMAKINKLILSLRKIRQRYVHQHNSFQSESLRIPMVSVLSWNTMSFL